MSQSIEINVDVTRRREGLFQFRCSEGLFEVPFVSSNCLNSFEKIRFSLVDLSGKLDRQDKNRKNRQKSVGGKRY